MDVRRIRRRCLCTDISDIFTYYGTSRNGYGIFGETILGKFNSLLLVWGGYVISGVSAATLTAAILRRHFNKRFAELEKLIEGDDE